MKAQIRFVVGMSFALIAAASLRAEEPVHWDVVQQIREEAFERSQIMDTASWLTDVYGPRNSKSTGYRQAAEWAN